MFSVTFFLFLRLQYFYHFLCNCCYQFYNHIITPPKQSLLSPDCDPSQFPSLIAELIAGVSYTILIHT